MALFLIASHWRLEFPQVNFGNAHPQQVLCRLKYLFIEMICNHKNEEVFMYCYEIIFKKYFCVKKQSTEQCVQEKKKKKLICEYGGRMSLKDTKGFSGGASGKVPACQCRRLLRDMGSTPGSGRSPGEGHGNPLQCSCLENPMDRGTWWATIHRVAKSQTQLKRLSTQRIHKDRKSLEGNRKHSRKEWTSCNCGLFVTLIHVNVLFIT